MNSNRGERLQLMLTPEELEVVDEFRFKHRMPTRAAAVRELPKRGLSAEGFHGAALGARSSEFGVLSHEEQNAREGQRPVQQARPSPQARPLQPMGSSAGGDGHGHGSSGKK